MSDLIHVLNFCFAHDFPNVSKTNSVAAIQRIKIVLNYNS